MIVKTRGIILSYIKYRDTSIIVRVFTEAYGYGSFIVNSLRSQKAKKSIGHFQPFSILELVIYMKEGRELQRISEFKNLIPLHHIHYDPIKSAITLFLCEVFSKLLQAEQSANQQLFRFAVEAVQLLDRLDENIANFHLQFLLKIGPHIGFALDTVDDLYNSTGKLFPSNHELPIIEALMVEPFGSDIVLSKKSRNEMLELILNYYQYHAHISRPKSLEVLRRILQ